MIRQESYIDKLHPLIRAIGKGVILFLIFLLVGSCQSGEGEQASVQEESSDGGFEAFYERFHQDSLYQLEHIQFPLQGVSSNPTDHHSAFRWQREDWVIHRKFDAAASGFHSEFTKLGDDFIIERIVHQQGTYGMERRFSRLGGADWYLIYYAALHPL